jgi:hypothetical protein
VGERKPKLESQIMNDDHLAAVANQNQGLKILLEMVSAGYLSPEEAMAEIRAGVGSDDLANKLARWFSRAMFYLAK